MDVHGINKCINQKNSGLTNHSAGGGVCLNTVGEKMTLTQPGSSSKHSGYLLVVFKSFLNLQKYSIRPKSWALTLEEAVALLELYLVVMVISFSWAVYFLFVSKPGPGKNYRMDWTQLQVFSSMLYLETDLKDIWWDYILPTFCSHTNLRNDPVNSHFLTLCIINTVLL